MSQAPREQFSFSLKIFGCQVNYYDGQKIAFALSSVGGRETQKINQAQLIVALACAVRQKAVDKLLGHLKNWRALPQKPKIVVVGCVLPADRKKIKADWLGTTEKFLANYPQILSSLGFGSLKNQPSPQHRTHQIDPQTGAVYVTITSGCNNFCSFCAVPYTRGREISRPIPEILKEVQGLVKEGYDYVILLGQNVNSFGLSDWQPSDRRKHRDQTGQSWSKDHPSPFVKLLLELEKIPGLRQIGFLSPNPQDVGEDLIWWVGQSKKFDGRLHLPLQSGSNRILKMMNRRYTAEEFEQLVQKIRRARPDIEITTDLIVGFPTESKEDFQKTFALVKKINFAKAYIAQYSPRPGTLAAQKYPDDVSPQEKRRRFYLLDRLVNKKHVITAK